MTFLNRFRSWMRAVARRSRMEREMDAELRFHIEAFAEDLVRSGVPRAEALRRARIEFGGVERAKEECRDARGVNFVDSLIQDLRFAVRMLRKNPGFTAIVIITLAFGIGANTAIFTLIHAVMLKSLPVARPGELYRLGDDDNCCVVSGLQGNFSIFSYSLYEYLRESTPEFSELAAFQADPQPFGLRRPGVSSASEPYVTEFVSGNYFQTFGVMQVVGRAFTLSDDRLGAPPTAIISYRAWRDRFGLDPAAIHSTVILNGIPVTLVGVAPAGFFGDTLRSDPPDIWIPLGTEPQFHQQRPLLKDAAEHWLYLIGRLRSGAQPVHVQTEVTVELQQWLREKGEIPSPQSGSIAQQKIILAPAGGGIETLSSRYSEGFRLLTMASGLVLLITCANIAGLVLAQSTAARLQTAIRVALGAGRRRLIQQTLTEGLLLALFRGAAGLFVAYAGARAMIVLAFRGARFVPIETAPSLPVIGFAFAVSLLVGLVFASVPSWITSKAHPAEALRGTGRARHDRSALPRKLLVVLQTALSLTLLVTASLLILSLRRLENQPFGFQTAHRVFVKIDPYLAGYTPDRLAAFYQVLQERIKQIPGIQNSSFSLYSPMEGLNWSAPISIEGHLPPANSDERNFASWNRISGHYFETIGTQLLRGRSIGERDTPASRHVTVINETFARKFFPNEDPLGKHLGLGDASHSNDFEIVGIVEDTKYLHAREAPRPTFFLPLLQMANYSTDMEISMQLRSNYIRDIELLVTGRPQNLEATIRSLLGSIAPDLTVLSIVPFQEQVERNFNQERLIARLTTLFGLLALFLACIGIYGVLAYSVVRRTNEIGIRMALGAKRWQVLRMMLGEAAALALVGVAIGVPAVLAAGRFLSSLLYDLKPWDPLTIASSAAILLAVASVAGFWPAYRASRVDPIVALRYE